MPIVEVPGYGQVEFPDSMSDEEIGEAIKRNMFNDRLANQQSTREPKGATGRWSHGATGTIPKSWKEVGLDAVGNIPSSAANFAGGLWQGVTHPIDTGMGLWDAAAGGLRNAMPESVVSAVESVAPSPNNQRVNRAANQVGDFYKNRYGGIENIKNTVSNDPVGVAADASALMFIGSGMIPKSVSMADVSPGMFAGSKYANMPVKDVLRKGAQVTNPVNVASKGAEMAGKGVANLVGGIGTHTGAESIKQAFTAGAKGGETGKTFRANMRNKVEFTDALDAAKQNVEELGRIKSQQYRSGMVNIKNDKTVLSFNGVDKAINDSAKTVTFKGQVKNAKAADVVQKMTEAIEDWKALKPNEFHTPEGMDALKQKIGGILESIPYEEKTARMVGGNIYNSIKSEISKQAPAYANVMKDYSKAMEEISSMEKTFSLGGKASVDTAMRKLQSLMRNNANTNYGNRLDLMKQLEAKGGNEVMPALAGQALSSWTPRGFGNAVAGVSSGLGAYYGGPMPAAAILSLQSPRLMGEVSHAAGRVKGLLDAPLTYLEGQGIDPAFAANMLYQGGRMQ